jgi:hypothetical protein
MADVASNKPDGHSSSLKNPDNTAASRPLWSRIAETVGIKGEANCVFRFPRMKLSSVVAAL